MLFVYLLYVLHKVINAIQMCRIIALLLRIFLLNDLFTSWHIYVLCTRMAKFKESVSLLLLAGSTKYIFDCSIKISSRKQLFVLPFFRVFYFSFQIYFLFNICFWFECKMSSFNILYVILFTIHQTLNTVFTRLTCIKITSDFLFFPFLFVRFHGIVDIATNESFNFEINVNG